ncbi:MAG TPA: 50S ribosomal protein L10 [Actinobacteria bacterium]|nr:50S ribosomal protein L10 [Actinomycetota bacterium]
MARPEKVAIVKEIKEKLQRAQGVILTDFRGLDVHELNDLRRKVGEEDAEYKIFKNTLVRIAAKESKQEELEKYLVGPTAFAFGYGDVLSLIKTIANFSSEHDALQIKAGILEGEIIDAAKIKALASLPPREELLARLLGSLGSSFGGLVSVLAGPMRDLLGTLNAVVQQKTSPEAGKS